MANEIGKPGPLVIQDQGSFAVGGTVITNPGTFDPYKLTPEGQTLHGDHAYVFYQIPINARKLPLVLWHGAGQFGKTWETTADGREGYQTIFIRRGFKVYVMVQPRRGRLTQPVAARDGHADEQTWFDIFRIGIWPNYFEGVQFSRDPEALNQYFRAMTPNTGPFDMEVTSTRSRRCSPRSARGSSYAFTRRRSGLAHGNQEPECPRRCCVRTGQQLHFPGRRSASPDARRDRHARGRRRAPVGVHAAYQNSNRDLLRRQHSGATDGDPGQDNWRVRLVMARSFGCGEPPRPRLTL